MTRAWWPLQWRESIKKDSPELQWLDRGEDFLATRIPLNSEGGANMRILFAGDEHPYSEYALKETIKLAKNTWADVTLLGIQGAVSCERCRQN